MLIDASSTHAFVVKIREIRVSFLMLILMLGGIGCLGMYSAANGSINPWALKQAIRFGVCFALMLGLALVDLRFWIKNAYYLYGGVLLMLIAVIIIGHTGKGAERWLNLGPVQIQPSELMKIHCPRAF